VKETFEVYPGESYRTVMEIDKLTPFLVRWRHKRIIAATSNLANCRPQNAWECLSRANKERNFVHMLEVIYGTERFFARKFEVTSRSKRIVIYGTERFFARKFEVTSRSKRIVIVVNNRPRDLSWLFVENLPPLRIQYFFVEKPRKVANFGKIRLHYFCTIPYDT